METIYEKYMALPIDKGLLCLEYGDIADPYFCYPVNAKPIGFEGCILYCFLPEYGEMVFACNFFIQSHSFVKSRFVAHFSYSNYTIKLVNSSTATLDYMRKVRTVFCPDFLAQS